MICSISSKPTKAVYQETILIANLLWEIVGHFSRDCPQGGGGGACHNCGEEGHRSRDVGFPPTGIVSPYLQRIAC